MQTRWMIIAAIVLILGTGLVVGLVPTQTVAVRSSAKHEFVIDQPMQRVRKVLVRTNSIKTIVAMADARLEDQQWLQLKLENDARLLDKDWKLSGEGQLVVTSLNSGLGEIELTLNQTVNVEVNRLESSHQLDLPSGPIQEYQAHLLLEPDANGKAHFVTSLELVIQTRASWLTRSLVESRIESAAQRSLENQETALRAVVAEQDDKLLILPDR